MLYKLLGSVTVSIQQRMGIKICNVFKGLFCSTFKTCFNFNLFWLLIGPPIVLQGNSLSTVSVSITLHWAPLFGEDWQTEHGKFIDSCKLYLTRSVHVHLTMCLALPDLMSVTTGKRESEIDQMLQNTLLSENWQKIIHDLPYCKTEQWQK